MSSTSGANTRAQQQQHYHHQQQQYIRQRLLEQIQQRRAEYVSSYELPLNYPANVLPITTDNDGESNHASTTTNNKKLRTSSDFINARLLEAGVPLGSTETSSSSSLADHSVSINRFIKDIEGTGCYDAVQLHLSHHNNSNQSSSQSSAAAASAQSQQQSSPYNNLYDISVKLKEKKWYKLYIGGGVNSDDLSSIGSSANIGNSGGANGLLGSKLLQFETSATLLNLTGYTDISSLSYIVDQTGSASFKFIHDRPLISYLNTDNVLRQWLLPPDPRAIERNDTNGKSVSLDDEETQIYQNDDMQYAIGGGSHTTLGIHATMHDNDYESTRSYKEYVRSIGVRLANHSRGATPSSASAYSYKPSISSPTSMSGPYLFLDWNIGLNDILPKRTPTHPFVLDCSPDIAKQAGTYIKHTLSSGAYLNGCYVDDRYDPTMGYDGHLVGEIAGPPGDVGYWKVNGGWSMHMPVELLKMMIMGVNDNDNNDVGSGYIERNDEEEKDSPLVIGMTLHSSFNCGILRPLTFNGLIGSNATTTAMVPSSDRFYIGGPNQLRGFLPAGIGPRANKGGSSVPGGDALGGDLFYTGLLATSIPFPTYFTTLRNNGARLFGFANAGTCVAANNVMSSSVCNQILQSTRVSIGGGVSAGTPMGRFEATYAMPIRYGPRDARKSVQFGFGFSFG